MTKRFFANNLTSLRIGANIEIEKESSFDQNGDFISDYETNGKKAGFIFGILNL